MCAREITCARAASPSIEITYKSKADRDRINTEVMNDPEMKKMGANVPFDGKRMFMGEFAPIVEA